MASYLQGIQQSKKLKVDGIGGILKGVASTAPVYNEIQLIKCSEKSLLTVTAANKMGIQEAV